MTTGMPFSDLMGLEIVERTKEKVRGRLTVREDLCTAGGILHGGAYMAFADALGAIGGVMNLQPGAPFELTWHNDELSDPPGQKPEGFGSEHKMQSAITELDPPRRLAFTWNNTGGVSFELEPKGGDVLLTVIHRRLPDRNMLLMVAAGWHAHLDVLGARANGQAPAPFWDVWVRLRKEYDQRLPG